MTRVSEEPPPRLEPRCRLAAHLVGNADLLPREAVLQALCTETDLAFLYLWKRCFPMKVKGGRVFQQVLTVQEPDTPWHLHSVLIPLRTALRPARLLCRFMRARPSPSTSRASRNFFANLTPNLMSALQPPHFHPEELYRPRLRSSQPQVEMLPRKQAVVTLWVTPALVTAYV